MNSSIKITGNKSYATKSNTNQVSAFWDKLEFSRYGIISMQLAILGCLGGLTAAFGAHGEIIKLAFVAFPTIISLALTLAVAPMRLIIWSSVIALAFDLTVFIL